MIETFVVFGKHSIILEVYDRRINYSFWEFGNQFLQMDAI
ncbi:hypothetical protein SAMN04487898_111134 [Pedobacter sp. ok626]|nr:hypothetical protein SAMN04487898_111134 [Pedobacter sp. ok626]